MPLQIVRQDITKMQIDAIVNTTNEEMIGYSGVDLAVHTGAEYLLTYCAFIWQSVELMRSLFTETGNLVGENCFLSMTTPKQLIVYII